MTNDFDFCCPTRIYFRENGLSLIGKIIKEDYHFSKVYLIYGGHSLKKMKAYDKVVASLNEYGIEFIEYSGIEANPDIKDIRIMVQEAKKFQPDLILACGGGSVLDAGKSVAHGFYYEGDPLDFNKHVVKPLHALPVGTILTLAASGSEMSDSCVVSDREHNFKCGFNSITNYPLFSLMDPYLTLSVPAYQVGVGLADMFCHSFERYFSPSREIEPSDDFALMVMKNIVLLTPKILSNLDNVEYRRDMMILGTLAHNGFTNYGKAKIFLVHKGEHILSGIYPQLTHGQGIALLMREFLSMNKIKLKEKILRFGKEVFSLPSSSSLNSVISAMDKWINSLPIAHSFEELPFEVKEEALVKAKKAMKIK